MNSNLILTMALSILINKGEEALKRAVTMPEHAVRALCARTGADPIKALEERDEASAQFAKLVVKLADADSISFDHGTAVHSLYKPGKVGAGLAVPDITAIAVMLLRTFGKSFVTRAFTIPLDTVRAICAKTGADPEEINFLSRRWTEEFVEFIDSMTDDDFVDPDVAQGQEEPQEDENQPTAPVINDLTPNDSADTTQV